MNASESRAPAASTSEAPSPEPVEDLELAPEDADAVSGGAYEFYTNTSGTKQGANKGTGLPGSKP